MPRQDIKTGHPARAGFYWAHREGKEPVIAQFTRKKTSAGEQCAWLQRVSDDPTAEKQPAPLEDVTGYSVATKTEVEKALAREPTKDECIKAALKAFRSQAALYQGYRRVDIPQSRRLAVSQHVQVGMLEDCRVEAFADDGQIVVVSYLRRPDHRRNEPPDAPRPRRYGAWHWTEVDAQDEPLLAPRARDAFALSFSQRPLSSLLSRLIGGNLQDSPDYQRSYVWTDADRERFLDSVFAQRDLGKFAILRRRYPHRDEILDGKQRLLTLLGFYSSQFAHRGAYWHELAYSDRNVILSQGVPVAEVHETQSRAYVLETFLELNTAGVPQSAEHLAHVRELLNDERAREAAQLAQSGVGFDIGAQSD